MPFRSLALASWGGTTEMFASGNGVVVAALAVASMLFAPIDSASAVSGGRAIDGDTIELRNGKSVRVIGIDTPEEGRCGAGRAQRATQKFIDKGFVLRRANAEDKDRYGRLLRSVTRKDGKDLGTWLITRGLAVARYDSRDGYSYHPQESRYHGLDARQGRNVCGFDPTKDRRPGTGGGGNWSYENCTAARNAGAAPVYRGEPGYGPHLDADGVICST